MREKAANVIAEIGDDSDPFVLYGSGIYNYFKFMERLLKLFFYLSILATA